MYARRERRVREQTTSSRPLVQVPRRACERVEVVVRRLVPAVQGSIATVTDLHVQTVVQQPWVLCGSGSTLDPLIEHCMMTFMQASHCRASRHGHISVVVNPEHDHRWMHS